MTAPTSVRSSTLPSDPSTELRLLSVLEPGLPVELGTPDEPVAYTVPLVFSRQVTPAERVRIEAPDTLRLLVARTGPGRTGPDLRLEVSDRRLLVAGTTLAELRDGLAGALTGVLREIDQQLRSASAARAVAVEALAAQEARRAAVVHEAVALIRFDEAAVHPVPGTETDPDAGTGGDR
ncbi:MAG TPA: hypothetical protein VGC67_01860 [Cellulomonas sp.]